eukprot:c18600_g1_i1 orf=309-1364(-)
MARSMLPFGHQCLAQPVSRRDGASFSATTRPKSARATRCLVAAPDHVTFVKEVAFMEPPANLSLLLDVLQERGAKIVSPMSRNGILPLAIPLAKDASTGALTALLRWPTPPEGMEMPVIHVQNCGVQLLAKTIDQYIHRLLVEEDASNDATRILLKRCEAAGVSMYKHGDFANSKMPNVQVYLMKKVGLFPDVFEHLANQHLQRGDQVSALITGEFYASKKHFPGFARPFVFNAELMLKVGRELEARDAAKVALKSPWWTLGCQYEEIAKIAGWGDEQIEYMKEKVTEEGGKEEVNKGKLPAQVALDQAAFLLDLASVDGSWDKIREQLAGCYKEAGLDHMSNFIALTDSN